MSLPFQPWRAALMPASYNGAFFHVEVGAQASGRRGPTHEFAKQDIPFTEDMGRRARRWPTTAYNIGPDYLDYRDALIDALEAGGPGLFVHPTLGDILANVDTYTMTETRERGGMCTFEIVFVESGSLDSSGVSADTQGQATSAANNLGNTSAQSLDTTTSGTPASTGAINNGPGGGAGFGGGSGGSPFAGPRA